MGDIINLGTKFQKNRTKFQKNQIRSALGDLTTEDVKHVQEVAKKSSKTKSKKRKLTKGSRPSPGHAGMRVSGKPANTNTVYKGSTGMGVKLSGKGGGGGAGIQRFFKGSSKHRFPWKSNKLK